MQYKDLISLLYSKHDIVLDNTLIRIAGRSLSKRCYLPFKTEFKDSLINLSNILNQGKHSSNSHYLIVEKNQTFEDFKQLFFCHIMLKTYWIINILNIYMNFYLDIHLFFL